VGGPGGGGVFVLGLGVLAGPATRGQKCERRKEVWREEGWGKCGSRVWGMKGEGASGGAWGKLVGCGVLAGGGGGHGG